MATEDTRDPDEVAGEIARTRSELDQTLEELGRRLSPERLKGEARSFVQDKVKGAREVVERVGRDYPVVALAAVGSAIAVATLVRHRRARLAVEERNGQVRALFTLVARAAAAGPVLAARHGGDVPADQVAHMLADSEPAREHAAALLSELSANGHASSGHHRGAMLLATIGLGFAVRSLFR